MDELRWPEIGFIRSVVLGPVSSPKGTSFLDVRVLEYVAVTYQGLKFGKLQILKNP